MKISICIFIVAFFLSLSSVAEENKNSNKEDYQRSKYDPIHFAPVINKAKDNQCLDCHKEVLSPAVREKSPAGVSSAQSKAWYQHLSTYQGDQETFHRRHLSTPYAQSIMQMSCITCHQGNEPRDEMAGTPPDFDSGNTLRKAVNPKICQQCHSPMNYTVMGLPSPWEESKTAFGNNCLTCHVAIRTNRHNVNYLKAAEIEKLAGEKGADVCFGCHGGRSWYRISYPYPRHKWPGMADSVPDWAKDRPTESEKRFQAGK